MPTMLWMVPSIHRHAGKRLGAQQFDELLDRGVGRDGDDFRPRLHGLADRLLAELHHRLDQVAIAFIEDAFFLARFDQRVHRFRLGLRRLVRMLLGQRGDRLQEPQHQRDGQHHVDQYSQQHGAAHQPFAPGPRKEDKRQEAVEQDDDEDQAERGLQNLVDAPAAFAKHGEADQQGDGSGDDLRQHRHGERGPRPAHSQPGSTFCSKVSMLSWNSRERNLPISVYTRST